MRYSDFKLLSEKRLEELRQSPGALKQFVSSEAAQGMQAGFEAELVFRGLAGNGEGDLEPDYDEDRRANTLDDIFEFFNDGPYGYLGATQENRIRDELSEEYWEWIQEKIDHEWDHNALENYISDNDEFDRDAAWEQAEQELGDDAESMRVEERIAEKYDEFVDEVWEAGPGHSVYDRALEEFSEEFSNDYDMDDFVSSQNWYMTDIADRFGLDWPYMISSGDEDGYNEENAERLADDLARELGVKTRASGGYHNATRDDVTWIFEPDSSLESDDPEDMPVEIISPPMPLSQAIEILPKFFAWAKSNGAYSNGSTGFHMSVSMPDHQGDKLDYTKLALLLGDQYVLKQFGRSANTYARSALSKIRDRAKSDEAAIKAMNWMREHLDQYAGKLLASSSGFGKYVSINPKDNYVEFRSAGGSEYMDDINRLQNTLMRYAQALSSAMNPEADKAEYARKLYKVLTDTETEQVTDPRTGRKRTQVKAGIQDSDSIWAFSRYAAGELSKNELIGTLRMLRPKKDSDDAEQELGIQQSGGLPRRDPNGNFEIFDRQSQASEYPFSAANATDAVQVLELYRRIKVSDDPSRYGVRTRSDHPQMPPNTDNGNYEIYSMQTGNRIWRFQAQNQAQAQRAFNYWYENIRNATAASPAGLRFVDDDPNGDQLLPFRIIYSIGQEGARSSYRVDARNRDEARRIFIAKIRDAGIDTSKVYTWEIDQLGSN